MVGTGAGHNYDVSDKVTGVTRAVFIADAVVVAVSAGAGFGIAEVLDLVAVAIAGKVTDTRCLSIAGLDLAASIIVVARRPCGFELTGRVANKEDCGVGDAAPLG